MIITALCLLMGMEPTRAFLNALWVSTSEMCIRDRRKIQRLFRRGDACRMIKRCNDFGAGGVSGL